MLQIPFTYKEIEFGQYKTYGRRESPDDLSVGLRAVGDESEPERSSPWLGPMLCLVIAGAEAHLARAPLMYLPATFMWSVGVFAVLKLFPPVCCKSCMLINGTTAAQKLFDIAQRLVLKSGVAQVVRGSTVHLWIKSKDSKDILDNHMPAIISLQAASMLLASELMSILVTTTGALRHIHERFKNSASAFRVPGRSGFYWWESWEAIYSSPNFAESSDF